MKTKLFVAVIGALALGFTVGGASAATVGVFDNGAYVDTLGGPFNESDTIQASIGSLGHTVNTFTGFSAADWTVNGALNDLLLIPELGLGDLNAAMSPADRAALAAYVSGGGGLIVASVGITRAVSLLNAVFGFSLSTHPASSTLALNPGEAAGTPFAGGPARLLQPIATSEVAIASLPGGALNLYDAFSNSGVSAARLSSGVFATPFGAGNIVGLGWDWFDAAPLGGEDDGWLDVLDRSVSHVESTSVTPVSEPSTVLVLLVGLGGLLLGDATGRWRRKKA